jgi:hypothetical protein
MPRKSTLSDADIEARLKGNYKRKKDQADKAKSYGLTKAELAALVDKGPSAMDSYKKIADMNATTTAELRKQLKGLDFLQKLPKGTPSPADWRRGRNKGEPSDADIARGRITGSGPEGQRRRVRPPDPKPRKKKPK